MENAVVNEVDVMSGYQKAFRLLMAEMNLGWKEEAVCRGIDPDFFFPPRGTPNKEIKEIKAVCAPCPVKAQCLQYALDLNETDGIWGGTSGYDRRKMKHDLYVERMKNEVVVHVG